MAFITRYPNKDILINKNEVQQNGFDKNMTLGQMIDLAIEHNCRVICKNGTNGKWYLKGKNIPYEDLKTKLDQAEARHRDGVYSLLIQP